MSTSVISVHSLGKSFGKQDVLKGIDLDVRQGQVVGLLGVNGSGKTTLIKCLLGLLRATQGNSEVFGESSWDLSANAKSRLGYVSQEFALLPWMTVQAMTEYTGAFYENWDAFNVKKLVGEWDLKPSQRVGALSVGQRQKLAVILALGHHPELLLLDEPVASLDPVARRQFLQSLLQFTEDEQHTILFSTHITSDLERVASHVAMLSEGVVGYAGELDRLKDDVKRVRLDSDRELPCDLAIPGALRTHVDGQHALAAVSGMDRQQMDSLALQWSASLRVEDLNLEEIFLELNGVRSESEPEEVAQ